VTSKNEGNGEFTLDIVKLTINGQEITADKGMTVLEAAQSAGIYIPKLCYDPDLKPYGACRLCVVEIENIPACPPPAPPQSVTGWWFTPRHQRLVRYDEPPSSSS